MSVRMVTRFVYVRVGGGLLGVPKRALWWVSRVIAAAVSWRCQVAWAFTPRLRLASAVCTGLRDSCCGEPLAEGYNNAQKCWPTRTQLLASALHDASCAKTETRRGSVQHRRVAAKHSY